MEIKLFGKSLFRYKSSKSELYWGEAVATTKESKYLPDFYKTVNQFDDGILAFSYNTVTGNPEKPSKNKKEEPKKEEKPKISPRGVYDLKLLNDDKFQINTKATYIDEQLASFKDKLNFISSEEYDMRRGVEEIGSIVMRMENRKKYSEYKSFFEEFPYTTSTRIKDLVKEHSHLQVGQIAQFIADLPNEATQVMKKYDENCVALCGKKAVFYIIADKKDFKQTNTRRDPILLAQSPFGHFWQILGAWDKEMLFLEEL